MIFIVVVKAEVEVEQRIIAETWAEAAEKALKVKVENAIPTPASFVYNGVGDTKVIGIYLDDR